MSSYGGNIRAPSSQNASSSSAAGDQSNSANMYRVGDYVYFENSSSQPYAVRRIEELSKTSTGAVEARVMCFYRRSELSAPLVSQADKHHWGDSPLGLLEEHRDPDSGSDDDDEEDAEVTREKAERAAFKLREVFLSRQVETLPATLIRGKCSVTLLSEVETVASYTAVEDAFFYALVYDPHQKTLVADRGEIRIGSGYQATVPQVLKDGEDDGRDMADLEEKVWTAKNDLKPEDIDKFLVVARSVGTFARALDCSSSIKQPSLHMSAAAASRDVTLFHAYDLLHKHGYKLDEAVKSLVPGTGPMLCRDEMEDWSASEATLFEEAMEKYGKDFNDIHRDYLPWKSMKNIIEYFFMWKTTDRYVQQKRVKALESESKLKQVYVPAYTHKAARLTGANGEIIIRGKDCDAYPNLPRYSWREYKKYGKFVPAAITDDSFILDKASFSSSTAARLAQLRPGLIIEPGSPMPQMPGAKNTSGKTRAAFFLRTTPLTRAARRLCGGMIKLRHAARKPGKSMDFKVVKAEVLKMTGVNEAKIRRLNRFTKRQREPMEKVVKKLGQTDVEEQEWLVLTPKDKLPKPAKEAFPRPQKRADGSYIYDRVPSRGEGGSGGAGSGGRGDSHHHHSAQMLYKRRAYEEKDSSSSTTGASGTGTGGGATVAKVARMDSSGRGHVPNVVPPKGRVATLTRISSGGQKQVISWMDAPDDVYYKATANTKRLRKRFPVQQIRRAARKPFKRVLTLP